jgi:RHS repeat-associated protein
MEKESVAGKETYCYNRRNQLTERKIQGKVWTYKYDKQGNLLEELGDGDKRGYGYNPFGQQTEVVGEDFHLENFYDGEFLRAGTSVNGKVSRFIYYNGELQAETDEAESASTRYILGYGVAGIERNDVADLHAYHLDEQNSTSYVTGAGGEIESFYEYDAFGAIRRKSEEIKNRILYTGQQYDQETGQYYLRARFYNPVVGRFLQEDVYRGDGLNLYAYCGNNPVNYYDPSGYNKKTQNSQNLQTCKDDDEITTKGPVEDYKVSEARRIHILEGDPPGTGHGPNRGHTTGAFPDTWTDDQAISAIERVGNNPASTWKQSTGSGYVTAPVTVGGPSPDAPALTNSGIPVRYKVQGQDHGLNIEVIIAPKGEGIITGYNKGDKHE